MQLKKYLSDVGLVSQDSLYSIIEFSSGKLNVISPLVQLQMDEKTVGGWIASVSAAPIAKILGPNPRELKTSEEMMKLTWTGVCINFRYDSIGPKSIHTTVRQINILLALINIYSLVRHFYVVSFLYFVF